MKIHLIVEPDYRKSFWCMETVSGLSRQANLLKIGLVEIDEGDLLRSKGEGTLSEGERIGQVVAVVGTSVNWINRIVSIIQSKNLLCLLVTGDQDAQSASRTNSIQLDYQSSMQALLSCVSDIDGGQIALFGVNPSSYADSIKEKAFPWKENVYYNYGSITACTRQLWDKIADYAAVICVNDTVAVHLLHFLQQRGISVPEQLRLLSFGDSFLSKLMQPSITSVEQDFRAMGAQAVGICSFLAKHPQLVVNAFIKCPLRIRESTKSDWSFSPDPRSEPQSPDVNFYVDESIVILHALDNLLSEADYLDIRILELMMENETQERIAEQLNLSLSALRYRIRKMRSCFRDCPKTKMLETIRLYLPADGLSQAKAIKRAEEQGTAGG